MKNKSLEIILTCVLIAVVGELFAQTPAADRLPNIERLLNHSSGAKQVLASKDRVALGRREQALQAFRQAREKFEAGDENAAAVLLNESARLMFEAIRLATPSARGDIKKIDNFEARRESVISLQQAFDRITTENNAIDSRDRINRQLQDLIGSADALLQRGRNAEARVEIDKAYHLLKVSIESIRSGQTLVRSLSFETRQDEYDYEIDRNDTHGMLVELLVGEKQQSTAMRKRILDFVSEARLLRSQAENFASRDAHEQAIELLEQSTRQLVRAIRSAGIYIPG